MQDQNVKRWTDKLVALQFLMVVLPVTLVLIGLTVADARRAAALASSSPLETLAHEVRADYKTFENGVADAVDSGALGGQAADALAQASSRCRDLAGSPGGAPFHDTDRLLAELAAAAPRGSALDKLLPLRDKIRVADKLTQELEQTLTAQNQQVLAGDLRAAAVEKVLVPLAIAMSLALTAVLVVRMRRRMRARLEADERIAAVNLRIKNALDNCSIGIMVADSERNIVYANSSVIERLKRTLALREAASQEWSGSGLIGTSVQTLLGAAALERSGTGDRGRRQRVALGRHIFHVMEDPVFDAGGRVVGYVLEWNDRTEEEVLEEQVTRIVEAASNGDFQQRVSIDIGSRHATAEHDFIPRLVGSVNRLLETSDTGLNEVARVLQALAEGNLTERITGQYGGTLASLKDNSNITVTRLHEMVGAIKSTAATIESAVAELSSGGRELSTHVGTQATRLSEASAAMQALSRMVRENADDAQKTACFVSDGASVASRGGEVMSQAVVTMGEISDASQKIAQIIGVVDEIAFQTNLLALNAAVEAARAGEQGRGFAVVASEVRSLAGRSAAAARQIKMLIDHSAGRVATGLSLVGAAGKAMNEIVSAVQQATDLIGRISAACQTQSDEIDKVGRAISEVDEATQRNTQLVEAAAFSADCLRDQAASLVGTVDVFKLGSHGHLARQGSAAASAPTRIASGAV
jgi:methyl-accepting chemotaxis protein